MTYFTVFPYILIQQFMKQTTSQLTLSYPHRLALLKEIKKSNSSFLKYNNKAEKWEKAKPIADPIPHTLSQITTLSFNVLYDRLNRLDRKGNMEHVLHSKERFQFIIDYIGKLKPTIIGLQEVTGQFWNMLLECEWARDSYWICNFKQFQQGFGNLLMSKIEPICIQPIKVKRLPRVVWTGFFPLQHPTTKQPHIVAFSSVHLIAYDKHHEIRVEELEDLVKQLAPFKQAVTDFVLQGDMNFHAEFQTQNATKHGLKDSWLERYENNLKQYPGYTFDANKNGLINELYWGFERRRMRLDRIFYLGSLFSTKDIKIVFTEPVYGEEKEVDKHMFLKGGLLFATDYFGWNLRGQNKQFLQASDHFGLFATLAIKQEIN